MRFMRYLGEHLLGKLNIRKAQKQPKKVFRIRYNEM